MLAVDGRQLKGELTVPVSKSLLHRYLICSYISGDTTAVEEAESVYGPLSLDVKATRDVILGGSYCGESGTTLRFMLAVLAGQGVSRDLIAEGSLVDRPMDVLVDELNRHGAFITSEVSNGRRTFHISGKLECGEYHLPGNISSQFISALMLASECVDGEIKVVVDGELQSQPYVSLTAEVVKAMSDGNLKNVLEGDWSTAAFWLVASYLRSGEIAVRGLNDNSTQADRKILDILEIEEGMDVEISVSDCPDLAPAIALWAVCRTGETIMTDTARLKLKESDRQQAIIEIFKQLGADIALVRDCILIRGSGGVKLSGSNQLVDVRGDHRIAMMSALASIVTEQPVLIDNPEVVAKSYPDFWSDFTNLGGILEEIV